MSDSILRVHPVDAYALVNNESLLIDELRRAEFIADQFEWFDEQHYRIGKRFADWISFSENHTVIVLNPAGASLVESARVLNRETCHISFNTAGDKPHFLGGGNTESPLCPHCQFEVVEFVSIIDNFYKDNKINRWQCVACHQQSSIFALNWRKRAGFGSYWIDIWNIHLNEAEPIAKFLDLLKSITKLDWTYFYYRL